MSEHDEAEVARAFADARNRLARAAVDDEIRVELERQQTGRRAAAAAAAVVALLPWDTFVAILERASTAIGRAVLGGGADAGRSVLSVSVEAFRFDRTDPRALAAAQRAAGQMVASVTDQTRQAVRAIIVEAFAEQITVWDTAARLQQTVGLTPGHARAVANTYRTTRERLLASGLSPGFAERRARALANQQAVRLHRLRAQTIARTEISRASGIGRYLGWEQAGIQGIMDMDRYGKRWISRVDSCPLCVANTAGGTIPIRAEFSFTGTLMPPGHPSCRCTAVAVPPGYGGWSPPSSAPGVPSLAGLTDY